MKLLFFPNLDDLAGEDGDFRGGGGLIGVIEGDGEAVVTEAEIGDGVPISDGVDAMLGSRGGGGHGRCRGEEMVGGEQESAADSDEVAGRHGSKQQHVTRWQAAG